MSQSESLFSKGLIRCNTTSHRLAKHHRLFFNVFVKKIAIRYISSHWSVDPKDKIRFIRSIRVQRKHIRMVNPCLSVSIRVQKIFVSFELFVFKNILLRMVKSVFICAICGRIKTHHPHGKSAFIRVNPCAQNIHPWEKKISSA